MRSQTFFHLVNCIKAVFCGFIVWGILFFLRRQVFSVAIFTPLVPVLWLLGPLLLYPLIVWTVFHYQLPPLTTEYILKRWPLWIPGYVLACLPSIDILILNKWLMSHLL